MNKAARQTLNVLSQNPQIVSPSVKLADAQADQVALDLLCPRLKRLAVGLRQHALGGG